LKSLAVAIFAALLSFWLGRMVLPDEPLIVTGGALFLGLILWTSVEKLWRKSADQTDGSDVFPLLDKKVLEKWGKKWGEQYANLNKIILYDTPLKYPLDVNYVLYFEFDTSTPEGKNSEAVFNETIAFHADTILASGFSEVYIKKPDRSFRDDWFLSINHFAGFDEEYSWVIYKK
jgi:hypothetical protein